ncbi:ClpXP protease specificity-enhancing factor SspB [Suttonella sp. R2A3]|uniref:stringent starvation protein B n=1 Tax=Suttonella sp. R2A3 TaxID=2908648 RepID=UPI001F185BD1|nr:ClpXP protease specificity-enhancing factor SspB [Suttonella sp. R2A3]UJF24568.1 ClpXP protease specificity-enhancing factor SspB [Suttonella sp. R2A3]
MMTDRKPYLLEAIYSWIVDNDCTPHLVIAHPGVGWVSGVPESLLQDEMLVLNISPTATQNLHIDDQGCSFATRFQGTPCDVFVALPAVQALVARENGEGMHFIVDEQVADGPEKPTNQAKSSSDKSKSTSHLKIIK